MGNRYPWALSSFSALLSEIPQSLLVSLSRQFVATFRHTPPRCKFNYQIKNLIKYISLRI